MSDSLNPEIQALRLALARANKDLDNCREMVNLAMRQQDSAAVTKLMIEHLQEMNEWTKSGPNWFNLVSSLKFALDILVQDNPAMVPAEKLSDLGRTLAIALNAVNTRTNNQG